METLNLLSRQVPNPPKGKRPLMLPVTNGNQMISGWVGEVRNHFVGGGFPLSQNGTQGTDQSYAGEIPFPHPNHLSVQRIIMSHNKLCYKIIQTSHIYPPPIHPTTALFVTRLAKLGALSQCIFKNHERTSMHKPAPTCPVRHPCYSRKTPAA